MVLVYLPSDICCFAPTREQIGRFTHLLSSRGRSLLGNCSSEEEFLALLPEASAALVWSFRQEWFSRAPRLRRILTPAAGKDYFKIEPPAGVSLEYGSFHGKIMAETALAFILSLSHSILAFAPKMQNGESWPRGEISLSSRRLFGQKVLIAGFGNIGKSLASLLLPFGAEIHALSRSAHPEYAALFPYVRTVAHGGLEAVLHKMDHVVSFLPRDESTENFFDGRKFSLMKDGAFFYNFGRGNSVDEAALSLALKDGKLGGAVLDVFREEPLCASSPLRGIPNCWLYPHSSAFSPDYLDLYFESVAGSF